MCGHSTGKDSIPFILVSLAPASHWLAGSCPSSRWFSYKIHFLLHIIIQSRNGLLLLHRIRENDTSKWQFFVIFGQLIRHPLIKLFQLFNLLQKPNDHRIVNLEFFSNFSCGSKRGSSSNPLSWSLTTSSGWPLLSSSSRLSFPLKNFLDHHCTGRLLAVPGSNALLVTASNIISKTSLVKWEIWIKMICNITTSI